MLKDQVAIITGGARGFGLTTAKIMAQEGCNIVLVDILENELPSAAAEVEKLGVQVMTLKADISKADDCTKVAEQTKEKFGKIDILINNAGVLRDNLTLKMKEEDWDLVTNVNLKGTFNMTKAVIKIMNKARKGKIVNIASVVGLIGNAGQANYVASKAGIIGLTKTWAREFAGRNVTVNAVAPGLVHTEMTESLTEEQRNQLAQQTPLGRMGQMEDIANAVTFLASSKADYITGVILRVDGGFATGT